MAVCKIRCFSAKHVFTIKAEALMVLQLMGTHTDITEASNFDL